MVISSSDTTLSDARHMSFSDVSRQFLTQRSVSSVCWVLPIDELSAGFLAGAVECAGYRSSGLIHPWPVDSAGLTVVDEAEVRTAGFGLVPVDLSRPELTQHFIISARRLLRPGDALVICGMPSSLFMASEFMLRCKSWGVLTVFAAPKECLPENSLVDLLIEEDPVASIGCTAASTSDFLSILADTIAELDIDEASVHFDRASIEGCPQWVSTSGECPVYLGEVVTLPEDGGLQVRSSNRDLPARCQEPMDLAVWDLVELKQCEEGGGAIILRVIAQG
ncbi:MAG: hypothetical protein Q4G30_06985 [Actinomycetaceae bacterium]|nr:hypothetical protein [Actinomycetaceae bacterium]